MIPLLDDFLSRDPQRVMHAAWETIRSRDPELLDRLIPALTLIRNRTADLELGGIIYSNRDNLEHAFTTLEHRRDGDCWCSSYVGLLSFDPSKEESRGHIRVLSTSEPALSMTYEVECTACGRVFDIEQGDYHMVWWKWVPRGEKRRRSNG